jgi:hypothetical protein
MTAFIYTLSDSATMLRRLQRYPSTTVLLIAMPIGFCCCSSTSLEASSAPASPMDNPVAATTSNTYDRTRLPAHHQWLSALLSGNRLPDVLCTQCETD